MTAATPEPSRLDRSEAMLESIVQIQGNQQRALDQVIEGQLAGQVLQGQLAEQTMQLKRAVDYLMSNDGGHRQE